MSVSKKGIAVAVAFMLALSFSLVGCFGSKAKLITEGTLTVGSDCDYPPFISRDAATGQLSGFEYDLLKAIADELGLKLKYTNPQVFDTLFTSVAAGTTMDVAVSSITINDTRLKLVDFSDPYFDSNQAIVALKTSNYTNAASLVGKRIGAQSGTTGEEWANENISGITMVPFTEASAAFAALQAGLVDAIVLDEPVASEMAEKTYTTTKVIQKIPTGEQYGIAVAKGNTELKKQINDALKKLKENGTYDTIFSRYFNFER